MALKVPFVLSLCFCFFLTLPKSSLARPSGFGFLRKLEGSKRGQTMAGLHHLKHHLAKFGYLDPTHEHGNTFDKFLESAIEAYQQSYGLKVIGMLDSRTVNHMGNPRCGMPDTANETELTKHHRLATWHGTRTRLKYRITLSDTGAGAAPLTRDTGELRAICARAFRKWADVSDFMFLELPPANHRAHRVHADIEIGFRRGGHGDDQPFDGPRGIVAHIDGLNANERSYKIHLDGDEAWSTNPSPSELDLESVVVHEIGHVLGLGHSTVRDAVMFPYFDSGTTKDLTEDDVQKIYTLYMA